MRNVRLTMAYDGTAYHGWQIQPGLATVQGELERVLSKVLDHSVQVNGSGRTDAGVHAHAQVANFLTPKRMDTDALLRALNALLPSDIRVYEVTEATLDFHARFSAKRKTYVYRLWRDAVVSPFVHRYVLGFPHVLDERALDEATAVFIGTHDFTSFCAASTEVTDRVRTVFEARWERDEQEWLFHISADGFLQYMVRTIVGTLLDVGQARVAVRELESMFAGKDRTLAGRTVPACGLHLLRVDY